MEQQFSLSWNNFHGNLSKGFAGLLGKGEFVDVTLAVEGHLLQAHKVVLSICSPYFKKMFQTNPCQHPIVVLRDVTHKAMQDLLQFMYHGEVSVKQEDLTGFIGVADVLQIKGLTNKETDEENEESIPENNIVSTVNTINTNSNTRRSVDNINAIYADELSHNEQIEILHQRQLLDKLNKLSALKRKSEEYIQHNFCTNVNMFNDNYNSGEKRPKLREKLISNRQNYVPESQMKSHDLSTNVSESYDGEVQLNSKQSNDSHNLDENAKLENANLKNGLMNLKTESEDSDIIVTDPAAHRDIPVTSDNNNTEEENQLQHDLLASPRTQEGAQSLVLGSNQHHLQLPDRYKYIYSRKGHKQLIHQNFVYTKHSTSHGKTSWRCVQYFSLNRCPATVETVGSMIYAVNHQHNHEHCLDKIINSCVYEMTFGNKE